MSTWHRGAIYFAAALWLLVSLGNFAQAADNGNGENLRSSGLDWSDYPEELVPEESGEDNQSANPAETISADEADAFPEELPPLGPDARTFLDLAEAGDLEGLENLTTAKSIDVDSAEPRMGDTALHLSVWEGHLDVVEFLLKKGADPNRKNKAGYTPLLLSTRSRHGKRMDTIKTLLLSGADPWATNNNGNNALHWCSHLGLLDEIEWMLGEDGLKIDLPNDDGRTALMLASAAAKDKAVKKLLDAGASLDMVEPVMGRASLALAAHKGSSRVVKILLEAGANREHKDQFGETAFDIAVSKGFSQVEFILSDRDPHTGEPLSKKDSDL